MDIRHSASYAVNDLNKVEHSLAVSTHAKGLNEQSVARPKALAINLVTPKQVCDGQR